MPARNVNLTQHLVEFIDQAVASGLYQNASEVVRDGLRLLEQRQKEDEHKLEALRAAVAIGFEDLDAGRSETVDVQALGEYLSSLGRP